VLWGPWYSAFTGVPCQRVLRTICIARLAATSTSYTYHLSTTDRLAMYCAAAATVLLAGQVHLSCCQLAYHRLLVAAALFGLLPQRFPASSLLQMHRLRASSSTLHSPHSPRSSTAALTVASCRATSCFSAACVPGHVAVARKCAHMVGVHGLLVCLEQAPDVCSADDSCDC
jgi:hypothetical protein